MKKICYITTISITIKSFFVEQLQYLSKHGYEVHVICSNDDELKDILGKNIKYIPVEMPRGINIAQSIKAIFNMIKIFKKEKYDMIQYSTPNAALYASLAGWLSGVKVRNYHLMGLRFEGAQGILRTILKCLEKTSCRFSTNIECVSQSLLNVCIDYNLFKKSKALVVWNGSTGGVDLNKFDISKKDEWRYKIRNLYSISHETLVYGFIGRITKDKGINELLYAFKNLNIDSNSKLMIIGDFEDKNELNTDLLEWSFSSENVIYTGFQNDVEEYFSAIDVLVLPSYREGFGNVIIEAEAMGVPVIVSNIYGPVDAMKDNYTGYIFELGHVDELIDKMSLLSDKTVRDIYSKNAYLYASQNFDGKVLCKHILKRKKELLEK